MQNKKFKARIINFLKIKGHTNSDMWVICEMVNSNHATVKEGVLLVYVN